ncbi:MAG: biotin/lipoyl-binding protein [Sporomusaceae bacterium]|nr:biotin/lipoyl-binding protein [Sporomusaceae bacterium]
MGTKMKIVCITILLVALVAAYSSAAGLVDQKGVVPGKVAAQSLVTEGMHVSVGTPLVMVATPVGLVPATRANVNGVVRQVLVQPGDTVNTGDVLVRLEAVQRR